MTDWPLEPSPEAFLELVDAAARRAAQHVATLGEQPATWTDEEAVDAVARSLIEPMPTEPTPAPEVLATLFDRAAPASFNAAGPGYLAYVPGGGIVHTAVASFLADCMNRYTGVWAGAPGFVQLESNVVRWFCEMAGYPAKSQGLLTSGGSLANFTAVFTARRERLPEDFLSGVIYTSTQVHHSVLKAALLAGFPRHAVRALPVDEERRLDLDAVAAAVAEDRQAGRRPFLLIASAGTTNTGAVDDLVGAADLAAREDLWLHVDAAYGGFFLLTERGRRALRGIDRADSITLDPHKGLFLPYGTGALLVRDGGALTRAHEVASDYLPPIGDDLLRLDYNRMSPELSRPFRGLRIWLPLKLLGVEPFRATLDEKLDLISYAEAALDAMPGVEVVARPQLGILAFRHVRPELDDAATDALNRAVLERILARQRVLLTPTLLEGRFVIRIAIGCFRTHRDRVDMALADIAAAITEVE